MSRVVSSVHEYHTHVSVYYDATFHSELLDFNPARAANANANVPRVGVYSLRVSLNRVTFLSPPSIASADTGTEPRAAVRTP